MVLERRLARLGWRRLRRLAEFVAYAVFDTWTLRRIAPCRDPKHSAIVMLELLGDYAMWRPFGRSMVARMLADGQKVTLVANRTFAPLAVRDFPSCGVLALDRRGFVRSLGTRRSALQALRRVGAGTSYLPSYPRDGTVEDAAIRALGAPAIGFDATFPDRTGIERRFYRRYYRHLLPPLPAVHQFDRHHVFVRALGVAAPEVAITAAGADQENYFVVAPGSSHDRRRWPEMRFAELCGRVLAARPDWRCVVVGTAAEHGVGEAIAGTIAQRSVNRCGATDIGELWRLIAGSRLVLCNDSAAGHIAAAVGVPAIAVVGGGHYGRCYPYPKRTSPVPRTPKTVSHAMPCFGCEWICSFRLQAGRPFPCIDAIDVEAVWRTVRDVLDGLWEPGEEKPPFSDRSGLAQ